MDFEILGELRSVQTFASGRQIRELRRVQKVHGIGKWRKRKGIATVRLRSGEIREAEVHWYEATGIGKREFKIKYLLD